MTWKGPDDLKPLLSRIDALEPHPDNPRRGVVPEIAASLERFGQLKPVVTMGDTIFAGNHVWRAAMSLGWTHLARSESDLSDGEAWAYLNADNRLSDIAGYDRTQLAASLARLKKLTGGLDGTGYDGAQVAAQLAALRRTAVEESDWRPNYETAVYTCPRCNATWNGDPRP